MGLGDSLIASGMARGLAAEGKKAAFGDRRAIRWADTDHLIFQGNPNVARPGEERKHNLVWFEHYRGKRPYGECVGGRWKFRDFDCQPGEVFLTNEERAFALQHIWLTPSDPVVIVEPRVKAFGACEGHNKQWPVERYEALVAALRWGPGMPNYRCVQLVPPNAKPLLKYAETITTPTFRHALALMGLASLYIGPEGGLHHGAAAMGTPAVVIFGGFNSPRSTGYSWHENIAVGEPCGRVAKCEHCREAMASIRVEQVYEAAMRQMGKREAA